MRAHKFTVRRRIADFLSPRLLPGKHRFCAALDTPRRESCIINPAAFDAMAARMFPEGATK